jgi:MYXO-CTERM domain-containing protein
VRRLSVTILLGLAAVSTAAQAAVDAGTDPGCYPPANLLLSDDGGAPDAAATLDAGPPSHACPGTQALSDSINAAVLTAPFVGAMPADTVVYIDLGLPDRNRDWLETETQQISDPTSACYGQFLTEEQFVAAYSPSSADYQAAIAFVAANGLTVTQTFSDRQLFSASGTVADINQTFCVTMGYYLRPDGTQFYSADRAPSINLSVPILAVDGLDNYFVSEPIGPIIDLTPPAAGAPGAGCGCAVGEVSPRWGVTLLVALLLGLRGREARGSSARSTETTRADGLA